MRHSGLYVGACPIYGYQKSLENKNQLVPDSETTLVVQRIFDMKIAGSSAVKIAAKLNEEGILSPTAYKRALGLSHPHNGFSDTEHPKWSTTTILRILKDENYTGTLVQGKQYKLNYKIQKNVTRPSREWVRCANAHEAIVPLHDFVTVQRILMLDTRTSSGCEQVNLFSGLLICGSCGRNMTRKMVRHGDIVYRYFYCPTGKRKGCTAPVMVSEDTLKEIVFNELRQHIEKTVALSKKIEQLTDKEIIHLFTKDKLAEIEDKHAELQKLQEYKSSLQLSEIRGVINLADCKDMEVAYGKDIRLLKVEIIEIMKKIRRRISHIDEQVYLLARISRISDADILLRENIVRLVKDITVFKRIEITTNFIFDIQSIDST